MTKLLDYYFRNTLLYDILIGVVVCIIYSLYTLYSKEEILALPTDEDIKDIASETITIILTITGFVLTFLTIIITFKENVKKEQRFDCNSPDIQNIFYNSKLYPETVKHIKNTVKSLILSCVVIYMTRLFRYHNYELIYFSTLYGISILIVSIVKSLFIINKVIDFQSMKNQK